jgi:hypothetical protein
MLHCKAISQCKLQVIIAAVQYTDMQLAQSKLQVIIAAVQYTDMQLAQCKLQVIIVALQQRATKVERNYGSCSKLTAVRLNSR